MPLLRLVSDAVKFTVNVGVNVIVPKYFNKYVHALRIGPTKFHPVAAFPISRPMRKNLRSIPNWTTGP
jgi:hypothetical protein